MGPGAAVFWDKTAHEQRLSPHQLPLLLKHHPFLEQTDMGLPHQAGHRTKLGDISAGNNLLLGCYGSLPSLTRVSICNPSICTR